MKQQVLDDLRAVRALIDTPEKWTQAAAARDASGTVVAACDPRACQWCLVGATVRAVCGVDSPRHIYPTDAVMLRKDVVLEALEDAIRMMPLEVVKLDERRMLTIQLNDEAGYGAVIAAIDMAIKNAGGAA